MEIRLLQSFLTVVQEGTITQAARVLHISQPALSKQIQDLEEEIGSPLIKRSNRTISLTEQGQFLYARAKEIISMVDSTIANLQEGKELSGKLRIGAAESQYFFYLAQAFQKLSQLHAQIELEILSGHAEDLLVKLDQGQLDFAFLLGEGDTSKYNILELPWKDRWGLLLPTSSPLADKEWIEAADLLSTPLIQSSQTGRKHPVAQWMGEDWKNIKSLVFYNLLYNASLMAQSGLGAVLCIDGIFPENKKELIFRPLGPDPVFAPSYIVWKKDQALSRLAKAWLDKVEDEIV